MVSHCKSLINFLKTFSNVQENLAAYSQKLFKIARSPSFKNLFYQQNQHSTSEALISPFLLYRHKKMFLFLNEPANFFPFCENTFERSWNFLNNIFSPTTSSIRKRHIKLLNTKFWDKMPHGILSRIVDVWPFLSSARFHYGSGFY